MKEEVYAVEKDGLINTVTSIDNDNILNIDPLLEPFIDTDELQEAIVNDEKLNRFGQKCASILSLSSHKPVQITKFSQTINRCTGIFYAILGSCLFTCTGFIIKQLGVDFFDVLLIRFFLQTSILTTFILYKKNKFINGSTNLIILQIIRAILSSSVLLLFFMSYRYLPLPDLITCRYTQVIWTAILAMIVFRERISIPTTFAIIFTLTGVIFVTQPTFLFNNHQISSNKTSNINFESDKSYHLFGLSLALSCALANSFSMVLNKKLTLAKIPPSIILFQYSSLTLCLLIINHIYNRFILLKYENQTMFTWKFFLASSIALIQVFSSTISQKAVKLEHPSIITVAQSSDILFAIILQNLFTNEKSNWYVIAGSFLVTTSIFLVGINKFCHDQKKLSEKNKIIQTKL